MFYQNIRECESKVESLTEAVNYKNPTKICVVETHILKVKEKTISGWNK